MTSKVFVDTNILVYAYDTQNKIKQRKVRGLLLGLEDSGQGVISTQIVQEFYVTVTKKLMLPPLRAKQIISAFDCFEIVEIKSPMIDDAIDISIVNQISFWDALVIASAQSAGCSKVWTEDLTHNQAFKSVRVEHIL